MPISLGRHLDPITNAIRTRMDETQVTGFRLRLIRPIFGASGIPAASGVRRGRLRWICVKEKRLDFSGGGWSPASQDPGDHKEGDREGQENR